MSFEKESSFSDRNIDLFLSPSPSLSLYQFR